MSKEKVRVVDKVYQIVKPISDELGLDIWDIKYIKEGSEWYLRVYIDKDNGVGIEDCEALSRAIDEPLDLLDAIPHSYCLEVSSPGLERKLEKPEHFQKFIGEDIKFKTIKPDEKGNCEGEGVLKDFKENIVIINTDEGQLEKNLKELFYVKLKDFY